MSSYFHLLSMLLVSTCLSGDVSFMAHDQENCWGATAADTCTITCGPDSSAQSRDYDCKNAGTCIFYCLKDDCFSSSTIDATSSTTLIVYSAKSQCYKDVDVTAPNYGSAYFLPDPNQSPIDEKLFKKINIAAGTNTELIHIECTNGINNEDCRQVEVDARTANRLEITGTGAWAGDNGNTVKCPIASSHQPQPSCIIDVATLSGTTFFVPNGIPSDIIITSTSMTGTIIDCNGNSITRSGSMNAFMGTACWQTINPTNDPTTDPTHDPTNDPTYDPTIDPTHDPTIDPTIDPTNNPTNIPTFMPTNNPSSIPTFMPTNNPSSLAPSNSPTQFTDAPSLDPTNDPTSDPTADPTQYPTSAPSVSPTDAPTRPEGGVDDLVTTQWRDGDVNNEAVRNVNPFGGVMIYVIVAGVVVLCCFAGFFCFRRYKRSKSAADTFKRTIELNKVNSMTPATETKMSNELVMTATNSKVEILQAQYGMTGTNGGTNQMVLMDDMVDMMLTPMGPPDNQSNDNINHNINMTPAMDAYDMDDDMDDVVEGNNNDDDDDDILLGDINAHVTPMGNTMGNTMEEEMDNDLDLDQNNIIIHEGDNDDDDLDLDDLDIITDVNAKVTTKGNDSDSDVIIENDENDSYDLQIETQQQDDEDDEDDEDILQEVDTLQ